MGGASAAERSRQVGTGTKAVVAGKVAARQLGNSRLGKAAWAGISATVRSVGRAARIFFLQVSGLLFVAFAVVGAFALVGEYRAYMAGEIGPGRGVLVLGFVVVFAWFGVSSFWRAERKMR